MAETKHSGSDPKVPAERADLKKSQDDGQGSSDRPGFNLSGGADKSVQRGSIPDTGPVSDPTLGDEHPAGKSQLTSNKGTPA